MALRDRLAAPPVILLAVFLAVAVFVDPLRDALTQDDSWFYAWTAQRMIADGVFRLHSYATASMPVQVFWATALSKIFGGSLITLRLSTLLLSCAGLLAFYGLLRDLALSSRRALGLALVYLCNPYGLVFSYSFMTDVQFTSWLLIALFLYGRGLRGANVGAVLSGSLAAAAAIGTRQFGVMLIGGLALCWAGDRQRRTNARLYVTGVALPVAAAIWQGVLYLDHPTWMQSVMQAWQAEVWRQGLPRLLGETVWRPVVLLQYAMLLVLPLWPLVLCSGRQSWRRVDEPERARLIRLAAIALLVVVALAYCRWTAESALGEIVRRVSFPSIPWFLQFYVRQHDVPFGAAWALLTAAAVVWLVWLVVRLIAVREQRAAIAPADRLPLFTGLCLLAGHTTFPTLIDTYAIPFVPLVLLVIGRELRTLVWPRPWLAASALVWLCVLAYTAVWLRGKLEYYDALFAAADRIVAAGVPPNRISAGYHWDGYHGAFDDWLASSGALASPAAYAGQHRTDKAYHRFIEERRRTAPYLVAPLEDDIVPAGWQVIDRVAYRDMRFHLRTMAALRRIDSR